MSLGQGNRELLTGNRKRVLSDFTFLHIPFNFSVHLLNIKLEIIDYFTIIDNQPTEKLTKSYFYSPTHPHHEPTHIPSCLPRHQYPRHQSLLC
ncbi:MAG: hypothetical protein HEQ20_07820 [Aphanizomenon flos-aquae KM1D3_PB]|uniref:hypothetical protein n=1 Tax=Aphanizomenon flos-aquae TaxID=1176 RepID=UPI0013624F2A|nr:hypothetical protein [Aphanizomenon flos-aquae]QSV70680.1 MAG: hypothetical protein HEQ20_07820 [Aphanizomenon flos-aquae KM1D3_PB]